ncbi:endonuclease/exonuclease/phosphatase family protein [Halorarius halobius]|uniref:endonuclease/exonuclease/phosphatase family protein n=1 Tax=Halorarius halobius TaxID=2962671 RepID=UPI0020CCAC09|nr:endonuclease/exonuclease/phosphatase family protein [Halorarius halobius]
MSSGSRLLRASLSVALLLSTLTYAVTRVFVLNFSTAGPTPTALLAVALVTGWAVPVAARLPPATRRRAALVLAGGGLAVSLVGPPVVALVGAAAVGVALTPLLAADARALGDRVGVAVAVGLLVVLALRGLLGAVSPYATPEGWVALVALFAALVAASGRGGESGRDLAPAPRLAPLFVAVFLAALWLGYPTVSARWVDGSYLAAVALSAVGLLAGAGWVADRGAPDARETVGWGLGLVGSLAVLLAGVTVAAVAPATAALVVLAATAGRGERSPGRAGLAVCVAQLAGLLCVAGFALAVNWAFVPGVGTLLRGLEPAFVLALGALLAGTAALAARTETPAAPRDEPPDGQRRALAAGVGAGLLGVVGALFRTPRPADDGPERLRVATYNVHQFVDASGAYNLRAVADLLRRQDAGVVGLQETAGARVTAGNVHGVRWLAAALGYHYHLGPATRSGGYGVALLSKWPLRDAAVVDLPTADTVPRPALRATVEHPDGAFPAVVAHLEVEGTVCERQARRVVEMVVGDERAVVLGDFNATPDERVYDVLADSLTDAWAAAGDGDGHTYSAARPRRRIDYAFVRGFDTTDVAVFGGPDASDHRGVTATLDRG